MQGARWEGGLWQKVVQAESGEHSTLQVPKALRESLSLTWAATVWDLVGNSFVTQAVLNPASERPKAARKPAPPAPTTTASNSWSTTGYCVEIWKRKIHLLVTHSTMSNTETVAAKSLKGMKEETQKSKCPKSLHPVRPNTYNSQSWDVVGTPSVTGASSTHTKQSHLSCAARKPSLIGMLNVKVHLQAGRCTDAKESTNTDQNTNSAVGFSF